jgi:S-formylglutathione hydrolase
MLTALQLKSKAACFGGWVEFYSHRSECCGGEMRFSVYLPPQAQSRPVPVLYFLAGLTCTEENFMIKAGAQQFAAKYGVMLVAPDTSPRGAGIPGEEAQWDLGTGAGFYVDATTVPWRSHYRMYSYITQELPVAIAANFPILPDRQGIFGHSMGGHGALICAFKNPDVYRSVSAFAPISAPMRCPWGQQAFTTYLGANPEDWRAYDASELIATTRFDRPILIDQGLADAFLQEQLLPDALAAAAIQAGRSLLLRRHPGYDHSYYFIASFIEDHLQHHAKQLLEPV